jgi:hypothetical protein
MNMNLEKEIERALIAFSSEQGIKVSDEIISDFIKQMNIRRQLDLPKDLYLRVCDYIPNIDMITLTTLSKKNMKYYKHIWGLIQNIWCPKSIIPSTEYLAIRNNMAIDLWMFKNNCSETNYVCNDIHTIEKIIKSRSDDLANMKPCNVNYIWKKYSHLGEIKACKKNRDIYLNELSSNIYEFIKTLKFTSLTDFTGEKYFTIKPHLDGRLYGFKLDDPEDCAKWEIKLKWVSGEYTDQVDEYDYDMNNPGSTDDFLFNIDVDGTPYRIRIRPDWC